MFEYIYVKTKLAGVITVANHHEIIDKYADEGWKLVQVLPVMYDSSGKPWEFEIVFERKKA